MTKIGIVTLGGYYNYGNKLQNLALEQVLLDRYDCEVQTIKGYGYKKSPIEGANILQILRYIKNSNIDYFWQMKRINKFMTWSSKYLHETEPEKVEELDVVITGSDQVWNPAWKTMDEFRYYLLNEFDGVRKISYAASIGTDEVEEEYKKELQIALPSFDFVSVREEKAVSILSELGRESAELVLDPTMLLERKQWKQLLGISDSKEQHIMTYFLGNKSAKMEQLLEKLVKITGLPVKEYHNLSKSQRVIYDNNPSQFVQDIASARVVLTDSFHASVFATTFHVPYVVEAYGRSAKMGSRIQTLMATTGMESRWIYDMKDEQSVLDADYKQVDAKLQKARMKSFAFLDKAVQ